MDIQEILTEMISENTEMTRKMELIGEIKAQMEAPSLEVQQLQEKYDTLQKQYIKTFYEGDKEIKEKQALEESQESAQQEIQNKNDITIDELLYKKEK